MTSRVLWSGASSYSLATATAATVSQTIFTVPATGPNNPAFIPPTLLVLIASAVNGTSWPIDPLRPGLQAAPPYYRLTFHPADGSPPINVPTDGGSHSYPTARFRPDQPIVPDTFNPNGDSAFWGTPSMLIEPDHGCALFTPDPLNSSTESFAAGGTIELSIDLFGEAAVPRQDSGAVVAMMVDTQIAAGLSLYVGEFGLFPFAADFDSTSFTAGYISPAPAPYLTIWGTAMITPVGAALSNLHASSGPGSNPNLATPSPDTIAAYAHNVACGLSVPSVPAGLDPQGQAQFIQGNWGGGVFESLYTEWRWTGSVDRYHRARFPLLLLPVARPVITPGVDAPGDIIVPVSVTCGGTAKGPGVIRTPLGLGIAGSRKTRRAFVQVIG